MKLQKNSIDLSGMILKIAIVAMIAAIFSVSALALEVSSQSGSPSENYIILKNAQFSTDAVPPSSLSSSSLSSIEPLPTKPEDYYIVQFKGLILEEWKKDVRGTGAVIFSYVPNNAFIVRMNTSVKAELENLDSVQWIGFYDPSYRVSSTLSSGSKQNGKEDVLVMLFDAGCNEYVSNDVIFIGGKILDNGESILKVRINQSSITDIAAINGVSWVDRYVQPVVLNDVAAGILNVSTVQNTHGLTGSGQIIAVADTGLDTGFNDASMHDDLEGRIDTLDAWWEEYNDTGAEDNHGHGTHVAGSVLGNGNLSAGLYSGMAPEARLVFQALQYDGTNPKLTSGRLHIPTNLYSLFQQAYDAGAKVHSNSWGSNNSNQYGNYTDSSQYVDSFMWDNPDLLIVFAAGNEGGITNKLTPPGTAKNALTVGASENYRPDKGTSSDNIDDIASFSSRGPTDDNRIKPDVVAPGTVISSTASSLVYSTDYTYMSGTSMATPLTAGTAALVRQYYVDNESISPTAALLKATLINGAADMGKSSIAQGWGRVDLESSLFPSSPRAMQYHDNISLGLTDSWSVSYHLNNSSVPFKATLVWTDQPATAFVGKTLVNNLDLNITGPDGNYLGNGGDDTNNVEHVELLSPSTGWYTVTVNGTNVPQGPQPFAIVLSGSFSSDEIAPASVTELTASDIGITWIKWTWNNPNDTDFNHTMLYLDNVFKTNVSNDTSFYNLTGLLDNTTYEFSTKTVDISGNINLSWTNDTATTLVTLDTIAPIVTIDVPEENHNYTSSTLWLNATANEDIAKWWYNINNTGDTTFSGNRSLTLPEGIHDITVIAQDIAGNNGSSMVNFSIDTIAPASVTGLSVSGKGSTWINWTWTNPSDGDFNYTMIYLDGVFKTNMTGASYNATGLIDNTEYNISTHTVDTVGIINSTWINDSASTLNTLPPASVTDLTTSGREITWINWTWNNPIDQDFNHTMLYLNNVFQTNVSNDTSFYNATGLAANTKYDFSTKTVDISGNINASWTNASATTKNPPTANFTSNVTLGKQPLSVQFIDSSTAAESWVWVFGDGNDANAQHPVHTYAEPGKYHVSLTANNSDGIDTVTKNNYIVVVALVPPFADFASNVTAGTEPLSVRFEDNSSNALTWEWDFGDVNTSNEIEPVHTYTTPGSYNVSLKVSNDDGSDYILKENFITVIALSKPIASFTAAPITGSYPLTVYFTEQSINETSWFWNFGDGNTSTEPDPSHTYVTAGTYNVSLNVSNAKYDNFTYISDYITVSTPTTDTTSSSSSGSSGGGGGSSVTSERYENILVKAVATRYIVNDIEKTFTFTEVIDITYINVTADLTVGDVKAIVESLNTTSNLVSKSPEGRVYKNINIWLGDHGFEKRIIDSSIGFRVEKTWLKENNVPEFSVRMSIYKGSSWNILPTYKIGEDDKYIYYEATSSEIYSSFAIVETVQKETTAADTNNSPLTENIVVPDTNRPSPSLEVLEDVESTIPVVKTESKGSPVKFLLFAIPLLTIISVSYVAVKRGHHIEAKAKMSTILEEMKPEKINDTGTVNDNPTMSSSSSEKPVSETAIPKVGITKSDVSAKIKELEESGILSNVNKKYLK
ncbi:S8 family serine peptidase [Methanococcoides sp.]|uniref:S8 family serine peptidase n=1 Tax=Methanococcoides sp. TaxID=1966350 RepID=UPI00272E1E68|nr:S8 family serine peptidase [Methanococcoides sp.]